ncbi:hypothetical protein HaLaN_07991, partial [Haematococcus lacustris]
CHVHHRFKYDRSAPCSLILGVEVEVDNSSQVVPCLNEWLQHVVMYHQNRIRQRFIEGNSPLLIRFHSWLTHGSLAHWIAACSMCLEDNGMLECPVSTPLKMIDGPSLDELRFKLGPGFAMFIPDADHDRRTPRPPRPDVLAGQRGPMVPIGGMETSPLVPLLDVDGHVKVIWDFEHMQDCYSPCCDVQDNRPVSSRPTGYAHKPDGGDVGWGCWSCKKVTIMKMDDETRLAAPIIPLPKDLATGRTVSLHQVINPATLLAPGVTCVDAPTGAGKTVAMVEAIRRLSVDTPLMLVVYRKSLVSQMIGLFAGMGFMAYNDSAVRLVDVTPVNTPRIVICAPSLRKMEALRAHMLSPRIEGQVLPQYSLVLDEWGQLRAMLSCSRLLKGAGDMKVVSHTMSLLAVCATSVLAMQYRLMMPDVADIMARIGEPIQTAKMLRYDDRAMWEGQRLVITTNEGIMFIILKRLYKGGLHPTDGAAPHATPIILHVNSQTKATGLHAWLRQVVKEEGAKRGWSADVLATKLRRIVLLTGGPQAERLDLRDPNAFAATCDVLIVTYVIQAGVSFTTHFVYRMGWICSGVGNLDDALQVTEGSPVSVFRKGQLLG